VNPSRRRRALVAIAATLTVPLAITAQGSATTPRKATAHGPDGARRATHYTVTPKTFRVGHGAGEPTLGITKSGKIFYTASSGCVTSCTGSTQMANTAAPGGRVIVMSADGGNTWSDVSPGIEPVSPHALSLDPYLLVDPNPDGERIFDVDLTAACAELSYSDDDGTTWTTNPMSCGEPVNDHQTVFTGKPRTSTTIGYDKVVYYCFNHPAFTKCTKSIDGGLTFAPTAQTAVPDCTGLNGHGVSDPKGVIYLPLSACGAPKLMVSKDEGDTWKFVQVSQRPADGDPSVAIDAQGNLYYLFVDPSERLPYLSTSRNGGRTWSKAVNVAPRGVDAVNLATLDVGKAGNVAIAYYGTRDADDQTLGWNGYLAAGYGVLGKSPTFYTATVNDPRQPLKMRQCGPGRCGRVLDFIDVEIGPDGRPWGAYVDACLATCERTKDESLDDNDGLVGTLNGAPSLLR
jgi:hypothetical protein